jgi:hypothetical protein
MNEHILTKNEYISNLERDAILNDLRKQGLTYQAIADMFNEPITRQAIHKAVKKFRERTGTKKADAETSA